VLERLKQAGPDTYIRPIKGWSQDESRRGLLTMMRRRITLREGKPVRSTQHQYANCWLYGGVAPHTGERYVHR
jgi:hypothetical protein